MARERWDIDPSHSGVHFTVRHMVFAKVHGRFTKFAGSIELEEGDVTKARVTGRIEAASIDTAEEKRDAHLRSPDFLDVEKFPELVFVSEKVERGKDGLMLHGTLEIRGEKRPVVWKVDELGRGKDPWGNERLAFEATTSIDRKEYGLRWNQALETGGVLVGDKVEIRLEVQAVKAQG